MRRYRVLSAIVAVTIGWCSWVAYGHAGQIGSGAGLTIFADRDFRGLSATVRDDTPDLRKVGLNDAARSLRVGAGEQWEVCQHFDYKGRCVVVSGSDADLSKTGWDRNISSARRIRGADDRPSFFGIELYSGPAYYGAKHNAVGAQPDLRRFGWNDRAESLRIRRGQQWEICADIDYQNCVVVTHDMGTLKTIGMSQRISSVRPKPR